MAYNQQFTERVRKALAHLPQVEEKKMFRGVAFLVNGKLCVSVGDDELMVRIDPARHEEALQRPGSRTVVMKGRPYRGYVYVQEAVLQQEPALQQWLNEELAFNPKAKASRAKASAESKPAPADGR